MLSMIAGREGAVPISACETCDALAQRSLAQAQRARHRRHVVLDQDRALQRDAAALGVAAGA